LTKDSKNQSKKL